jgi:deoxyhypusine monooxygenase
MCHVPQDQKEHAMVRHEAAEALGSIASPSCLRLLQEHTTDPEPIVAHSCVVALDMMEHEASGAFEYAAVPDAAAAAAPAAAAPAVAACS